MSRKLRCILLDDELPGLTYLKMLCEQFPELEVVRAYDNPSAFLEASGSHDFDLCIMDIEMPGINGLQIANLLRDKLVIFVTAYTEHAAEAFDLDAVDYVRKPVSRERLHQAVLKAQGRMMRPQLRERLVQLNTDKGKAMLSPAQIVYITTSDTDSRDKLARLADGSVLTLKNVSFERLQELLPVALFVQVNKKEVVAVKSVQLFSFDEVTTHITAASGHPLKLTLSPVYRNAFLERMKSL